MDLFTQTLPGTLSTTAKLSSITLLSTRDMHMSDRKRNTRGLIREFFLLYQSNHSVNKAGQSKNRTVKRISA